MIVDVAAHLGAYPFREVPGTDAESLIEAMDRVAIDRAWVGYLPSAWHNDVAPGNEVLCRAVDGWGDRLVPVPTVHPDQPDWQGDLDRAVNVGAPAVRAYPMHSRLDPAGEGMRALAADCRRRDLALQLTVRFEDVRQRVASDVTPDFPAAAVRALARLDDAPRMIVLSAGREYIEEVHFGLTDREAGRLLWDINWLWGPPANDVERVVASVGIERFAFGSLMPLRLPEAPVARLDLLDLTRAQRDAVEHGNLGTWQSE